MGLSILKSITVAMMLVLAVGCSKKSSSMAPAPTNQNPGNGNNTGGNQQNPGVTTGAEADLQVVSFSVLEEYAGRRINNPSAPKIHIDVFEVSQGQYGGTLRISYRENGQQIAPAIFRSGTSVHDTRYNKWTQTGGAQKLKLMFQDHLGAIVVIIDQQLNDLGIWKGDIYYRNFDFGVCSNPPFYGAPVCNVQSDLKCWNITAGPYDCRAFLNGNDMRPDLVDLPGYGSSYTSSGTVYPRKGYQKLGTFMNLNLRSAINAN